MTGTTLHVMGETLPHAFARMIGSRDALASPEAANNLLATTALTRETAVSDALWASQRHRLDRPRSALGGGGA